MGMSLDLSCVVAWASKSLMATTRRRWFWAAEAPVAALFDSGDWYNLVKGSVLREWQKLPKHAGRGGH